MPLPPLRHAGRHRAHELIRQADELVGQHGAADHTLDCRDCSRRSRCSRRARYRRTCRNRRGPTLPSRCALANCVPPSRSDCRVRRGTSCFFEFSSRRADSTAAEETITISAVCSRRRSSVIVIRDARDDAARVGHDLARHAPRAQFAVPGGQRRWDHGILRAAFGVHLAGEPHAPAALHARRPSVIGHRVAQHGNIERVQAEALRGRLEDAVFAIQRQRRHGQRLAARPLERVGRNVSRDTDFVFGLLVIRFEIGVGDRPVARACCLPALHRWRPCGSPSPDSATPARRR